MSGWQSESSKIDYYHGYHRSNKKITHEEGVEKGIERGIEQKSHEIVKNLLTSTDFDAAKIATLAGVSTSYVEKVKQELSN